MTLECFYTHIGGDYCEVFSRLCTEERILKFIRKYPADPTFQHLKEAVNRSDWTDAFRAVHTLKGVALNLDFGNLYRAAAALSDALLGGAALSDFSLLNAVIHCQQQLLEAISRLTA